MRKSSKITMTEENVIFGCDAQYRANKSKDGNSPVALKTTSSSTCHFFLRNKMRNDQPRPWHTLFSTPTFLAKDWHSNSRINPVLFGEALIQVLFITSRGRVRSVREWWSNGRSSLSKHVIAPSRNFDPYLPAQLTQNTHPLKSNFNSATICWVLDA